MHPPGPLKGSCGSSPARLINVRLAMSGSIGSAGRAGHSPAPASGEPALAQLRPNSGPLSRTLKALLDISSSVRRRPTEPDISRTSRANRVDVRPNFGPTPAREHRAENRFRLFRSLIFAAVLAHVGYANLPVAALPDLRPHHSRAVAVLAWHLAARVLHEQLRGNQLFPIDTEALLMNAVPFREHFNSRRLTRGRIRVDILKDQPLPYSRRRRIVILSAARHRRRDFPSDVTD